MTSTRLGSRQRLVLLALEELTDDELTDPPTAAEVADRVARRMRIDPRRPVTETENCQSALRTLERRTLVARLGVAAGGARTWVITDAGRAALDTSDRSAT